MMLAPRDENDLAEIIARTNHPFALAGLGSKAGLGRPVDAQVLSLAAFAGVKSYEPAELILEAGAATPLVEIYDLLEQNNQHLAFDPPDYSGVLEHLAAVSEVSLPAICQVHAA
jgi:glycolate oxidase FAD binding subunit